MVDVNPSSPRASRGPGAGRVRAVAGRAGRASLASVIPIRTAA